MARFDEDELTLRKMRTTPAWSAPVISIFAFTNYFFFWLIISFSFFKKKKQELLKEKKFTEKSDIFSFGIVLWELVNRCMKRCYQRPYSEYKGIHYDYQIIVQVANNNLRPTMPPNSPPSFVSLFQSLVQPDPEPRPNGTQTLTKIIDIQHEFESSMKQWNELITKTPSSDKINRQTSGDVWD